MDRITRDRNIDSWLASAPQPVLDRTQELLQRVAEMRASETIYPPQDDILNALAFTGAADVHAVILGQDPYHGPNQAMGLSFSVPATQPKLPPSLKNIYKELAADLGCNIPATGDLTPWAEHGVLLLNTTLTVREHAANSHAKLGWQALTDYVVERCCTLPQPVVFLAWGRFAQKMVEDKLAATAAGGKANKFCLASTHPSPLSARRASAALPAFMGSRPFSRANALLEQAGAEPIDWACIARD